MAGTMKRMTKWPHLASLLCLNGELILTSPDTTVILLWPEQFLHAQSLLRHSSFINFLCLKGSKGEHHSKRKVGTFSFFNKTTCYNKLSPYQPSHTQDTHIKMPVCETLLDA